MYTKQKLSEIFKSAQLNEKGKMKAETAIKVVRQIGLNMYEPKIRSLISMINSEVPEQSEKQNLTSEGFALLVQLINEPFNKQIWQKTVEIKQFLKQFKKEFEGRDFQTRDREMEGKLKIKVGPEQQFQNIIKLWFEVQKNKKIMIPWINLHFTVKQEGKRQALAHILKQIFQTILKFIGSEKPQFQKSLNQISIQTSQTSSGVQMVLQIRNEKLDQLQQQVSTFIKQLLQTEVNGKVQMEIKTNYSILNFIDLNSQVHFFNVVERDCEISLCWTVSRILTAIKQFIIKSELCIDLQYDRLNPPALAIISLTNVENLDCEIQFQNTISSQDSLQLVQARKQLIAAAKSFEGIEEMLQQFHIIQLLELIGDDMKIQVSFSTANIFFQLKLKQLARILKQLFGVNGEGRENNSQMNQERNSDD